VTARIAGVLTNNDVPPDRGVEPGLALVQAEAAFSQLGAFPSTGLLSPAALISQALAAACPSGTKQ
jgi:hypothetical protein